MGKLKDIVISLLKTLYLYICKDYKYMNLDSKYNILVSYISEPFFRKKDKKYMNSHQNRAETLIIADVFKELNFSFKFIRLDKKRANLKGYNIIFGVEPNFVKASLVNEQAIKIYYATGAYMKHQNRMIKQRTDIFNQNKGTSVPYYRMIKEHNSVEKADFIIQIGSQATLSTYPKDMVKKILTIRQSCHDFYFENFLTNKLTSFSKCDFVWMGSEGSILKGFDLVVDYFIQHSDLKLHLLGKIDKEVWDYYQPLIKKTSNIIVYGFVDLDSEILEQVALKASFVIMPSASEGCPGSVINMMKLGCVPLVTPYASFDGISNLGILIQGYTYVDIDNAIKQAMEIDTMTLQKKIEECYHYANDNYNRKTFHDDLKKCFESILLRI